MEVLEAVPSFGRQPGVFYMSPSRADRAIETGEMPLLGRAFLKGC